MNILRINSLLLSFLLLYSCESVDETSINLSKELVTAINSNNHKKIRNIFDYGDPLVFLLENSNREHLFIKKTVSVADDSLVCYDSSGNFFSLEYNPENKKFVINKTLLTYLAKNIFSNAYYLLIRFYHGEKDLGSKKYFVKEYIEILKRQEELVSIQDRPKAFAIKINIFEAEIHSLLGDINSYRYLNAVSPSKYPMKRNATLYFCKDCLDKYGLIEYCEDFCYKDTYGIDEVDGLRAIGDYYKHNLNDSLAKIWYKKARRKELELLQEWTEGFPSDDLFE